MAAIPSLSPPVHGSSRAGQGHFTRSGMSLEHSSYLQAPLLREDREFLALQGELKVWERVPSAVLMEYSKPLLPLQHSFLPDPLSFY